MGDVEVSSTYSLESQNKDENNKRVYRIFLVCWFIHAILGIITLVIDYEDKEKNSHAYYYVLLMTFKWFFSAILTLIISFFYILCLIFVEKKTFGEYIGVIYMLFSVSSSIIIVLAVPFGFRAIYISTDLQFMTLLFIQLEIILDCMIVAEVVYNIAFSQVGHSHDDLEDVEQAKGIKEILSNHNLDRLQKEILQAYEHNDLLNFEDDKSHHQDSSPERTHTNTSESQKRRNNENQDRNSCYPISEIGGEK